LFLSSLLPFVCFLLLKRRAGFGRSVLAGCGFTPFFCWLLSTLCVRSLIDVGNLPTSLKGFSLGLNRVVADTYLIRDLPIALLRILPQFGRDHAPFLLRVEVAMSGAVGRGV
jgi:hypothetical protein